MGSLFDKTFCWCLVGLVAVFLFYYLEASSSAFSIPGYENSVVLRASFFISSGLAFLLCWRFDHLVAEKVKAVALAAACAGSLHVVLAFGMQTAETVSFPLAISSCVLFGLSWAGLIVGIFSTMKGFTDNQIILIVVLSLLFFLVDNFLLPFASKDVVFAISLLLPPCACASIWIAGSKRKPVRNRKPVADAKTRRRLFFRAATLAFSLVAIQSYTQAGLWGGVRYGQGYYHPGSLLISFGAVFAIAALGFITLRFSMKRSLSLTYYFSQSSISILFMAIVFLNPFFPEDLQQITTMPLVVVAMILCQFCFIFSVISTVRVDSSFIVKMTGASFACLQLFWLIRVLFGAGESFVGGLFVLAGAIAGIVVLLVSHVKPAVNSESAADRYQELALEHDLSDREIEILHLLVQGRNVPRIQKDLFLAEGTVRNYITRIYKKFGVKDRQELLDLLKKAP